MQLSYYVGNSEKIDILNYKTKRCLQIKDSSYRLSREDKILKCNNKKTYHTKRSSSLRKSGYGWLVNGWLVNGWLVNGWLVNGWLVNGWLVNGWLVNVTM